MRDTARSFEEYLGMKHETELMGLDPRASEPEHKYVVIRRNELLRLRLPHSIKDGMLSAAVTVAVERTPVAL